ncbi:MAG: ubiquinone/menaquinone biosynthesis methyltransferase [Azospirillum sp.]|nr:ubiquinone/menaquinone biosynthesis methyltransferase [Azospirillum sp.]
MSDLKDDDQKSSDAPEARWFGYREIDPEAKAGMVRAVFDSVAGHYDLMNDLMSGGIHRLWKAALINQIRPRPDMVLLDVAGGTGDVAMAFRAAGGGPALVCDINPSMVEVGRDRAIDRGRLEGIGWSVGDAEALPIASRSVDIYSIAFGLRNVTHMDLALAEARRVLKPGGRFFCLEFSRVVIPGFREAYDAYSFAMVPWLGRLVTGDAESYRYLVESIRQFPDQESLSQRIAAAGFARVRHTNLSGGIAAIHTAWRL